MRDLRIRKALALAQRTLFRFQHKIPKYVSFHESTNEKKKKNHQDYASDRALFV